MPEKNEEMSLRDALISAVTADPAAAEAQNPAEEAEMAAANCVEYIRNSAEIVKSGVNADRPSVQKKLTWLVSGRLPNAPASFSI